jgi:circadian clock protein KaiC
MRAVGIHLEDHVARGDLAIEAMRPTAFGLEEHLIRVHMMVEAFKPDAVIMDPITSFTSIGDRSEVKAMIIRLLDHLKGLGITIVMPSLTPGSSSDEETETEVSSMVDAWIIVHFVRKHGTRRRVIYMHKARGIGHSQDLGELVFSPSGIEVTPLIGAKAPRGGHD